MKKILLVCLLNLIFISDGFALVRITEMDNFAFGTWSGSGQLQASDTICIYDSQANMNYGIRATGSGAASAFTVASGAFTLAYGVQWQGSVGAMTTLTTNVKTVFNNANRISQTCGGAPNATLRITFTQANLEAAEAGTYSGVLTLLLTRN